MEETTTPTEAAAAVDRPVSFTEDPAVDEGRFAVYDEELLRYVGAVLERKPTDKVIRDLVGDHAYSVHSV